MSVHISPVYQVFTYMSLYTCAYRPEFLAELANDQLSSCDCVELSSVLVLASLSSVYISVHHAIDGNRFTCYIYISILPTLMNIQ